MGTRRLDVSLVLASVCLIVVAHQNTLGGQATEGVDFCAVARAPQDHAGRLVRVRGVVSFGFEESAFRSGSCGVEAWIEKPDEHGNVREKPTAGTRVILGVSFDQYREWYRAGVFADPSNLPWRIAAPAKPVKVVRNKLWQQFSDIPWNCPTEATLIGRFDYIPGPGFVSVDPLSRFVWQASGYGHLDAHPLRFVVTEVVTIEGGKQCKRN